MESVSSNVQHDKKIRPHDSREDRPRGGRPKSRSDHEDKLCTTTAAALPVSATLRCYFFLPRILHFSACVAENTTHVFLPSLGQLASIAAVGAAVLHQNTLIFPSFLLRLGRYQKCNGEPSTRARSARVQESSMCVSSSSSTNTQTHARTTSPSCSSLDWDLFIRSIIICIFFLLFTLFAFVSMESSHMSVSLIRATRLRMYLPLASSCPR